MEEFDLDRGLGDRLEALLLDELSSSRVPGVAVSIRGPKHHVTRSVGVAEVGNQRLLTRDSKFEVSCFGRLLVALVAYKLVSEGKLDLNSPIANYLQELSEHNSSKRIAVRHLLTHVSGYRGKHSYVGLDTWSDALAFFKNTQQLFLPGFVFSEDQFDYILLGEIIRRLTGSDVYTLISAYVLQPLGIAISDSCSIDRALRVWGHHIIPETGRLISNSHKVIPRVRLPAVSNIALSVGDMSLIGAAIMNCGDFSKLDIFNPAICSPLRNAVIVLPKLTSGSTNQNWSMTSFGNSIAKCRNGFSGMFFNGFGQSGAVLLLEKLKVAVAIAINIQSGSLRANLLERIVRLVQDDTSQAPSAAQCNVGYTALSELLANFSFHQLVGCYLGPYDHLLHVRAMENRLQISIGGEIKAQMGLLQRNRFYVEMGESASFGVFKDMTGQPGVMFGLQAFRKVT